MMSCPRIVAFTAAALLVPTATAAAEGGYVEAVLGVAVPIAGDEGYEDLEEEVKVGVHAGSGSGPTALELSLDFTPFGDDDGGDVFDVRFDRFRVLAGARHRTALGKSKGTLFFRGGIGVDLMRFAYSGTVAGIEFDYSDTDPGLAAEVGTGFTFPLGDKAYVGAHVAVPFAMHFDADDPDDAEDIDLEYTAIDLDVLFTVGTTM